MSDLEEQSWFISAIQSVKTFSGTKLMVHGKNEGGSIAVVKTIPILPFSIIKKKKL